MDYLFGTKPFAHQLEGFALSRDKEYFALLMEQGTGKTKLTIDTIGDSYCKGEINAALVIAPNGVHRMWITDEIPTHCPEYIETWEAWYSSQPRAKERDQLKRALAARSGLKIVSMNVEALATKKGYAFAKEFLIAHKAILVVDESSVIKNHKAIRTKNILKLRTYAVKRRILTGTPVTQGPLDVFTQFNFLDPTILGMSSYYGFRNRYAIMREMQVRVANGTRSFMQIVGYTNMDELKELIAPHSFRVLKSDCLDLPDKLYQKRYVYLSEKQRKIYAQLKKEVMAEFDGTVMTAPMAMTKLMRMQQVIGGYFTPDVDILTGREIPPQAIDVKNTRVEALAELVSEIQGKIIIWARFNPERNDIVKRLRDEYGEEAVVEYHGSIDSATRAENVTKFQDPTHPARFFVGNVQAGGKGLTLHQASTVIYFSNNFSLEDRLQSEDRAHRIGQTKNVTYIDLVAVDTMDYQIVSALRGKKNIADMITGDEPLGSWL